MTLIIEDLKMDLGWLVVESLSVISCSLGGGEKSIVERILFRMSSTMSEVQDLISEYFSISTKDVERWKPS